MRLLLTLSLLALSLAGGHRTLTLKQAIELADRQNPDLLLARLDEQRAALEVQAVKEPVLPRLIVGSGLAYSNGMPMSIEGAAPAVIQAKAVRSIWNAPQGYQVAQAREAARGATLGAAAMREEITLRVAALFLDLERAARQHEIGSRQIDHFQRVEAAVRLRAGEGRELPLDVRRASLEVARARLRLQQVDSQRRAASQALILALGLDPSDELMPALEQRPAPEMPLAEEASVAEALRDNQQIRRLEADLAAKNLEGRSFRAMRLPRVDLVAQYGLLAKFNNFEEFFNRFQRHNTQIGASVQIPIFPSSADEARAAQSQIDARRLRTQIQETRRRIESDTRRTWQKIHDAEASMELARMDLDLAREQVGVLLAQMEEGRARLHQIEQARSQEEERWMVYYDAGYQLEVARLELLHLTHSLSAALR